MNGKRKITMTLLILVLIFFILSACDHTELTGTIHMLSDDMTCNTEIPLELDVPDELSNIHDVMWGVFYEDATSIDDQYIIYGDLLQDTYSEEHLKKLFNTANIRYERIAIFTPIEPGSYHIIVDGFYKQTNPQPITEIEITIK